MSSRSNVGRVILPRISVQGATNAATDFAYYNSETFYPRIDTETAPSNERHVREALNLAIGREAFQGTILADGVIAATRFVLPSAVGWSGGLKVKPFDLDHAKAFFIEVRAD